MTCRHVDLGGGHSAVVCDGCSGGWRVTSARCPWCCVKDEAVRCLSVLIYGDYEGSDYVCGKCGYAWIQDDYAWSQDDDVYPRVDPQDNEARQKNIALVASTPDPKCWDCHDTGDTGMPGLEMPGEHPCKCGAERRARSEA